MLQRKLGIEKDSEVIEHLNIDIVSPGCDDHAIVVHAERHDTRVLEVRGGQHIRLPGYAGESAHNGGGLAGGSTPRDFSSRSHFDCRSTSPRIASTSLSVSTMRGVRNR